MLESYKHTCLPVNNLNCLTDYKLTCNFQAMKYGERLKQAMDHAQLNQKQLATATGDAVTQQNISLLIKGNATGSEFTVHFAKACGVRCEWLALGEGEMVEQGVYVTNDLDAAALKVMQEIPIYAKPDAIKSLDTIKKLTGRPEERQEENLRKRNPRM